MIKFDWWKPAILEKTYPGINGPSIWLQNGYRFTIELQTSKILKVKKIDNENN